MKESNGQVTAVDLTKQVFTKLLSKHDATNDAPITTIIAEHVSKNDEMIKV